MILDTNVLLDHPELINNENNVVIPMNVLEELDKLKTKRVGSREVLRRIIKYIDNVTILENVLDDKCADNNILKEISEWININGNQDIFYTNDYAMLLKAKSIGLDAELYKNKSVEYNDPFYYYLTNEELNYLYNSDLRKINFPVKDKDRKYNYILCFDENKNFIDIVKYNYNSEEYELLKKYNTFDSSYFGKIRPKDEYQKCLFDSLLNDDVTLITGPAGSGKSIISLAYCMYAIEKGLYDKLVILTNPVKAKDTIDLGFYPGTKQEKLLDNSIGNILSTKFGDSIAIEQLISQNKINIQPFSDIRGIEIRENEIMYVTEMQNSSISLAKLAIQRAKEGAKIIFEGDTDAQVDMLQFEDSNNGLKRCIEVLSGRQGISHIKLDNIYRSRIAELAELL